MNRIMDYGGMPTSLGEIINIKYHCDLIKNQYDQIKLSFHTPLWKGCLHMEAADWKSKEKLWNKYLADLGKLFFSESPYVLLANGSQRFGGDFGSFIQRFKQTPQKVELAHLLCAGEPLNLGEEYIVITTKIRHVKKNTFYPLSNQLWRVLSQLSNKYKIVILGERQVEMRKEYMSMQDEIFGIYEQIISNIPNNRILDLTVPALGETVSDITQIQQDCLIMNQAKLVINIGAGGNSCMANAVSKMSIGFREDNIPISNIIFGREYPNMIYTKDWSYFIQVLERYL